ncbi:protein of unknown function [Paraburkholderia kururiensis]
MGGLRHCGLLSGEVVRGGFRGGRPHFIAGGREMHSGADYFMYPRSAPEKRARHALAIRYFCARSRAAVRLTRVLTRSASARENRPMLSRRRFSVTSTATFSGGFGCSDQ